MFKVYYRVSIIRTTLHATFIKKIKHKRRTQQRISNVADLIIFLHNF